MSKQIELIRQALSASESSIRLAKQLLSELEYKSPSKEVDTALPGIIGTFDGENMVTESGDKYPVPANYASKSMLIVGDTMKLVNEKGEKRFKQIEHVKRYKTKGTLTKKEGKFHVVSQEGSYRVLPASVDHSGIAVGEELQIVIPAKNQTALWAAIESPPSRPEKAADKTQEIVGEEKTKEVKEKLPEKKDETKSIIESKPEKAELKKVKVVKAGKKEIPKVIKEETTKTIAKSVLASQVKATKTNTQKPPVVQTTIVDEELA